MFESSKANRGRRLEVPLRLVMVLPMLALGLVPGLASAAARPTSGLNITTSPLPITLTTKPGQTVSTNIKVKQSSGATYQMKVSLLKFGAYGTAGKPSLSQFAPGDVYQHWVTFDKPTFSAPNNVWQTIKMTIKVPKEAAFEYNYAVVFTRVGDAVTPGGNTEAIAGGSAVLVLMNVYAPGAHRSLQLTSFGVEHGMVEFLPVTFDTNLYNNGNVYVQPAGDIVITQGNRQVGMVMLNDEQGNILAHTHRDYKVEWSDGFPYYQPRQVKGKPSYDRHGNPIMDLNWGIPPKGQIVDATGASQTNSDVASEGNNPLAHLRFGEYTARLVAVYKDDFGRDVPITATVNFWVVPWRILIGFLILLLIFGFAGYSMVSGIMRRRRRLQRLKRRQGRKVYEQ